MKKIITVCLLIGTTNMLFCKDINATNNKEKEECNRLSYKQRDLTQCAYVDRLKSEEVLNDLLVHLKKALSKEQYKRIEESQKAWKVALEKKVDISSITYEGGTMRPMACDASRKFSIILRISELLVYACEYPSGAECKEKDIAQAYVDDYYKKARMYIKFFVFIPSECMAKIEDTKYFKNLKKKYPNVMLRVEDDKKDKNYYYFYLGFDEKSHTTRNAFVRVDKSGVIEYSTTPPTDEYSWRVMR